MPSKHARLSASASLRWINCPGSVRLTELFFEPTSSMYADEGTAAHERLEGTIKEDSAILAQADADARRVYQEHPELDDTPESMKDNIDGMYAWLMSEYQKEKAVDPAAQIYSEQQVDLSQYIPGGFGTTDATIARTGLIHIVDLKYGKGIPVSADGNTQLRLYALGMLEMLDMVYDIRTVRMTIYQPRLDNISTDEMSAADLRTWGEEVIVPAAKLALSKNAPFHAGEWCQFCAAKNTCRERFQYMMELEDYRSKTTLTDQEIGRILGRVDDLVKWASNLKDEALEKIQEGEDIPGWKVVEGRSVRRFSADEATIVSASEKAGFAKALLYETKMLSLSQIEKLMGKSTFATVLGGYVEKPQGKPTLAPISDKRPSITGASAAEVFKDEIDDDAIPFN